LGKDQRRLAQAEGRKRSTPVMVGRRNEANRKQLYCDMEKREEKEEKTRDKH
jgi:hypothetical protein